MTDLIEGRANDGGVHFALTPCFEQHLGLKLRRSRAHRRLRRLASRSGWRWSPAEQAIFVEDPEIAADARAAIADALTAIAEQPLTPRLVCLALGITSQERVRWTKDGRLPRAATILIRRGQVISVATYPVQAIAALVDAPDILAMWRRCV